MNSRWVPGAGTGAAATIPAILTAPSVAPEIGLPGRRPDAAPAIRCLHFNIRCPFRTISITTLTSSFCPSDQQLACRQRFPVDLALARARCATTRPQPHPSTSSDPTSWQEVQLAARPSGKATTLSARSKLLDHSTALLPPPSVHPCGSSYVQVWSKGRQENC